MAGLWYTAFGMNTTINVSIPDDVKRKALRAVNSGEFPSMDDLVLAGIRQVLPAIKRPAKRVVEYFVTPEFEKELQEAENEPLDQALTWDGKGSFTEFVLKNSKRIHRT